MAKKAFGCLPDLIIVGLVFVLAFLLKGLGATYYVSNTGNDTNAGTSMAAAWATLTNAAVKYAAGDTIFVNAGTYTNDAIIWTKSSTNTTYILATNGMPIINRFTIQANNYVVQGFEFNGDITSSAADEQGLFYVKGTRTNITLLSSKLHDPQYSKMNIIRLYSGSSSLSNTWQHPSYITIASNELYYSHTPATGSMMFQMWGGTNTVRDNYIHDSYSWDALQAFGRGHLISNNVFSNITQFVSTGNHADLFQIYGDAGITTEAADMLFVNNRAYNSPTCQVFMIEQGPYPTGVLTNPAVSNITFRNNLFANIGSPPVAKAPYVTIENNTFYKVGYISAAVAYALAYSTATNKGFGHNGLIRNNLFIECGGLPTNATHGRITWELVNDLVDYNNLFVGTGPSAKTPYPFTNGTIAGGFSTNGTIYAALDPYLSTTNWMLSTNSPAYKTGTNLSAIFTYDINGNTRTNWSMGAYDYAYDASTGAPPATVTLRPKQPEKGFWILNRLYHLIGRNRKPRKCYAKKTRTARRARR